MSEWGNPVLSNQDGAVYCGGTRGTEISKYPKENKSNEIPLVATSESGIVQTIIYYGVVGLQYGISNR